MNDNLKYILRFLFFLALQLLIFQNLGHPAAGNPYKHPDGRR